MKNFVCFVLCGAILLIDSRVDALTHFNCPKFIEYFANKAQRFFERPSFIAADSQRKLFNKSDPRGEFLKYLKLLSRTRYEGKTETLLSKSEYEKLLAFIQKSQLGFWDSRSAEQVYGKSAGDLNFRDAFEVIHREYLLQIAKQLDNEYAKQLSRTASVGIGVSKFIGNFGYVTLIGGIFIGLVTGFGSSIAEVLTAITRQVSFEGANRVLPPGAHRIELTTQEKEEMKALQSAAVDHYRQFQALYPSTEQISLGRVTWYETSILTVDIRLAEALKANDKKEMAILLGYLIVWEKRFRDLHETDLGGPAIQHIKTLYEKYDPDGSLRKEALKFANSKS